MVRDKGQVDESSEQLVQLERKVRTWKWWVAGFAVCLVATYLIYFGVHLGQSAATDASTWGTFGDFVGGLMNPVVAFAAFFWLTESVKIQKQELADTRAELAEATRAQNELVKNGRDSVNLAALAALLNANNTKIDLINQRLNRLEVDIAQEKEGRVPARIGNEILMTFSSKRLTALIAVQKLLLEEIKTLEARSEELQASIELKISGSIPG
ncbi:hypothetical protein [Comamonas sp.]|uniref:hypothetical protein n=1 Tax=Comamonas sp. TaxID=34028 RepID=UPI0028AD9D9B|nr:hypothetical protein [Comamonas sp.]